MKEAKNVNEQKEKFNGMNWFYRPWFYWSYTSLLLITGIVLTIMLIIASKVIYWYGYVIGPACLLIGLIQIPWYFMVKKGRNESQKP